MRSLNPLSWSVALLTGCLALFLAAPGCGDDTTSTGTSNTGGDGGGVGGSGGTQGVGGNPGCTAPEDCPLPEGDCMERTCDAGTCGTKAAASGTPAEAQVPGDCHVDVCDGSGGVQTQIDDTDIPDDNSACTEDSCDQGVEQHETLPAGSPCGVNGICDPSGACIGCNTAADCAGQDTECEKRTCINNECGSASEPKGTPLAIQDAGDCKVDQCDGNGGTETVNDDADLPDDFNECTMDACTAGVPSHTPTPGTTCGIGLMCNAAGECAGCTLAAQCGVDDFCKQRTCTGGICGFDFTPDGTALPTQVPGDCKEQQCDGAGGVKDDPANSDVPVDGNECTGDVCTNGAPSNPDEPLGTACNGGVDVCNATGTCVQCNSAPDCSPPANPCQTATCALEVCGTANAPAGTVCGPATCAQGVESPEDTCDGAGTCDPGASTPCAPFICGPTSCTDSCANDNDCAAGNVCDTGISRCIAAGAPKCTDYCSVLGTNCSGATFGMYPANANCLAVCAALPIGATTDTDGNTVGCRLYHAGAAAGGQDPHCGHAGPGGEGQCGANCESFCSIALAVCTGANEQYATVGDCLAECNGFPVTPKYSASQTSGDSFACRLYHLTAASVDPDTHCDHIKEISATCN